VNHYPRHIGDYLKKTVGLSMVQDGAYNRAIDWYYSHEKPLPRKPDVYGELRCLSKADRDAVDVVLSRYFREGEDGYRHERCDEEVAKYREKSAKAATSASARWGANAMRTHPPPDSERNANAVPTQCEGNASQEPIASNQEKQEGREQREPRSARARGSRLNPAWELPEDWGLWAMQERGWTVQEARRVAAEFRDHWLGKGESRADWLATWRNWVRRERRPHGVTKTSERERIAGEIYGEQDERRDEHVIDGEAQRLA
jgi:uncharacterized protein YdaU (DUF1376 family)